MAIHLLPRHNGALNQNPPAGDRHITTHASDWLWAVFAIMLLSFIVVLGWTYSSRRHTRVFHYIPLIVLAVASVAYFSMASDLGWTLIRAEFHGHGTRQIWYVRYIQWFINAPLLLFALLSFTGISTAQILVILFFSWFLVVNGLIGALVSSSYKWAYFVFGLFGLFFIWIQLLVHVPFQPYAFREGAFKKGYLAGAAYLSFIWLLYPICWGLSDGGNKITPTSEMVFYGIIDILAAPVFLFGFIVFVSQFNEAQLARTAFGTTHRGEDANGAVNAAAPAPAAGKQQRQVIDGAAAAQQHQPLGQPPVVPGQQPQQQSQSA